jgi:N-acetylmuramoyl-L-alanine amidase
MRTILQVFIAIALLLAAPDAFARTKISSFGYSENKHEIVVSIEANEELKYRSFILAEPDRVVIDLENVTWSANFPQQISETGIVKRVRVGNKGAGGYRVVIETNYAVHIKQSNSNSKKLSLIIVKGAEKAEKNKPVKKEVAKKTSKNKKKTAKKEVNVQPAPVVTVENQPVKELEPANPLIKEQPAEEATKKPRKEKISKGKIRGKRPTIIIDAGHGGMDPGAIGKYSRVMEKSITLKYATALAKALRADGFKVKLVRSDDTYINLKERVEVARSANGDFFISLHADSNPDPDVRGLSVYTLSERRADFEAQRAVAKSDSEEVIRGLDLSDESSALREVIIGMAQRDSNNRAAEFAELLVRELGLDIKLLKKTHREAGLQVLTGIDIPSILVELGYLSNATEEKMLQTQHYQAKLISGIRKTLNAYYRKYPLN